MMICWNCSNEVAPEALFCGACETLQPPRAGRDFFEVLEVPRSFQLDAGELEASFKRLSRRLHPDRFATAPPRERRYSLEHATALNDAYRTLRVPVKRGEYLLGCWGRPIGENTSRSSLPMEFLETVMELREQIAEAKFEQDREGLARHLGAVEAGWREHYARIEALFARGETTAAPEAGLVAELEQELHMLRYLQNILSEYGVVPAQTAPSR